MSMLRAVRGGAIDDAPEKKMRKDLVEAVEHAESAANEAFAAAETVKQAYERIAARVNESTVLKAMFKPKPKPPSTQELVKKAMSAAEELGGMARDATECAASLINDVSSAIGRLAMAGLPFDLAAEVERVVALAGKSSVEIVAMSEPEVAAHVARCTRDARIAESSVKELARRAGCPGELDGKEKQLQWLFACLRSEKGQEHEREE
eukprot:CAMPEP_0119314682 /NCGR_PEP_ID=MMETSP1333-20130426/33683_1 /TAXON_ID=418940 /ORGANISM="Scyphosphaera apsteinii, Strain RCC1455" /LENGTH=206 /DNA_ID=CAMNT_0007319851 /DNA_START=81 /DNA_END=701 /DNA_ORIENTATION=+